MQKTIFFSLFTIFLLVTWYYSLPQAQNYMYYVYEREWPGSVCLINKCTSQFLANYDGSDFNTHGLWPSGLNGQACPYPTNCLTCQYDQSLLSADLITWMNKLWVGLYSDAISFRAHEFTKHGTCWNPPSPTSDVKILENGYVGKVKDLNSQYNLMSALSKGGISPRQEPYSFNQIVSAIKQNIGQGEFDVQLTCSTYNSQQILVGVDLCLTLSYQLGKCLCPRAVTCNQSKSIQIPPFKRELYNVQ